MRLGLGFLGIVMVLSGTTIRAQDEDEPAEGFEKSKSWFFHLGASALTGGHKQAEYFNGEYSNLTFRELYDITIVRNDINASAGYSTYLGEYPAQMRYQWTVQVNGSFLYYFNPTFAAFARFSGSRVTSSGTFLLYADNPSNPFGEPLIFEQQMRGLELRTWYMAGVRFESEPLEKGEINPFLELSAVGGGIKPIRSEAIVQNKRYNLFSYDPNLTTDTRLKPGYGAGLTIGVISWIRANKAVQLDVNATWVRLKTLPHQPNALYMSISAGFML